MSALKLRGGVNIFWTAVLVAGCGGSIAPIDRSNPSVIQVAHGSIGRGTWQRFSDAGYLQGIVRTSNGDVWVADGVGTGSVSRLTAGRKLTIFQIGHTPLEMTSDERGDLWVTVAHRENRIVRVTYQRHVTWYSLHDVADGGIIVGGDGNVWFAEETHVGELTPGGKVTEYPTGETQGETGLAWANGLVWFRAPNGLASLNPKTAIVKKYHLPIYQGGAVVAVPDGSLWCTVGSSDGKVTLVRFDTRTGKATTFKAPDDYDPYGAPADTALAPDGSLWYATQHVGGPYKGVKGGGFVRFDRQTQHFTVYSSPKGYAWQWDLTVAPDGKVWATSAGAIAVLDPDAP